MKWILLYFTLVSLVLVFKLEAGLRKAYINGLVEGYHMNNSILFDSIDNITRAGTPFFGIGILILIYMQFKDNKSLEIGRFLKSLPISNREYYMTKLISGIMSYTIPFILMIVGILIVRESNINWIQDYHNISKTPEMYMKQGSVINILSIFIMCYFIITATYTFLFMVQYLVTNIVGGIVIGILAWLAPTSIVFSLHGIYAGVLQINYNGISEYIQPWVYHLYPNRKYIDIILNNANYGVDILVFDSIIIKTIICLIIYVICTALAYIISENARVEDMDNLIPLKSARSIFVIGVTICSALVIPYIFGFVFGGLNTLNFIVIHIMMVISGIIGFVTSRKILSTERK